MAKSEETVSRVTRSKQEAKVRYNQLSRWYDTLGERGERKCRGVGLQKLDAGPGEIVLDAGCGTGHGIEALAQAVRPSGKVCGIDLSEMMIDLARARIQRLHLSDQVELQCADATRLPFRANVFDGILISFTLELFDTPEIPIVLGECKRVLRRGGRLCVVALSKSAKHKYNLMVFLYELLHRWFPRHIDCRPIFVKDALEGAGFGIVGVTLLSIWGLPVEIVLARKQN